MLLSKREHLPVRPSHPLVWWQVYSVRSDLPRAAEESSRPSPYCHTWLCVQRAQRRRHAPRGPFTSRSVSSQESRLDLLRYFPPYDGRRIVGRGEGRLHRVSKIGSTLPTVGIYPRISPSARVHVRVVLLPPPPTLSQPGVGEQQCPPPEGFRRGVTRGSRWAGGLKVHKIPFFLFGPQRRALNTPNR